MLTGGPFSIDAGDLDLSSYASLIDENLATFGSLIPEVTHKCHCEDSNSAQCTTP